MRRGFLLAVGIILAGIVVFFIFYSPSSRRVESPAHVEEQRAPLAAPEAISLATNSPPPADLKKSLAGAFEMAIYVDRVESTVPKERATTHIQLKALKVVFFLSDYVMAAKTNEGLPLTKTAVMTAFSNVSTDTNGIKAILATYAVRPGTLADHYLEVSENPEAKASVSALKSALDVTGTAINTNSDLLMDCIRYSTFHTEINDFYGNNPSNPHSIPFPAELASLQTASDAIFEHRFESRFGLSSDVAQVLMKQLQGISVTGLSDADMQIPAHFQ